jgi:hypothetical protein
MEIFALDAIAEDSHVNVFHATDIDGRTSQAAHISDRCHFRLVCVAGGRSAKALRA